MKRSKAVTKFLNINEKIKMNKNNSTTKILIGIFLAAGFLILKFNNRTGQEVSLDQQSKSGGRSIASVIVKESESEDDAQKTVVPDGMTVVDQEKFLAEAKDDSMTLETFTAAISQLSSQTGWNLKVEITADGKTHVRNTPVKQDFSAGLLPAFTEQEWAQQEENFINLVNNVQELNLTRDDQIVLEMWKKEN